MTAAHHTNRDRTEAFVADLTLAAYRVALEAGTQGTWVELQLGLWRALADKVQAWEHGAQTVLAGRPPVPA